MTFNLAELSNWVTFNLADLFSWRLLTWLKAILEKFLPSWILYWMTFKLGECSIKVTGLLEYLNLTLDARSWVSLHNTLAFTQILLYYCKEFLQWLIQLHTDFQFTTLNSCSITGWIFYSQIWLHNFDTSWVLCHISVVFFQISFKSQKGTPTMVTRPTCQISSNSFHWFTV